MLKQHWQYISHLGIKPEMEVEQQKKIILSNQISVIFFFVFFMLNNFVHLFYVPQSFLAHLSAFTILTMPLLNKYGYNRLSTILVSILTPGITLLLSTTAKLNLDTIPVYGYIFPRAMLISYISLPFILISKKNKGLMYSMVAVDIFFAFIFDYFHTLLGVHFQEVVIDNSSYQFNNVFLVFPTLIIVMGYFFLTNINAKYEDKINALVNELENKNNLLEHQKKEIQSALNIIEDKNQKITDSILYAKRIQNTFLPSTEAIQSIIPHSFILYLPRDIVSGDFYWVQQIDDLQIIIAADCTGHGVPGAFVSILGTTLLDDIILMRNVFKPSDILDELRTQVKRSLNQSGKSDEQKDGMDIAVCVIDTKTNQIQFSGAHNSLYIIRNQQIIELKADRQPIGVFIKEKPFTNHECMLQPNDAIYLFSDGYVSQFGGNKGDKFKSQRFKDLLLEICEKPLNEQKDELCQRFQTWKGKLEQVDDILVIGVRV